MMRLPSSNGCSMTEWSPPDRSRSRAILVGTATYTELTGVPAAAQSLERMRGC
jgi:hypothetical protein